MSIEQRIYLLIGGSRTGKTTVQRLLSERENFELLIKGSTRKKRHDDFGLIHLDNIVNDPKYDIGMFNNNHYYACKSNDIEQILDKGKNPVVVFSNFSAIEKLRKKFGDMVVATYIHRPVTKNIISETLTKEYQAGMSREELETEVERRFENGKILNAIYPLKSYLVDGVLLNSGTLDQYITQINNLFTPDYRRKRITEGESHLFILAGATSKGKRIIPEYFRQFGGSRVKIIPKETKRPHRNTDGPELISVDQFSRDYNLIYSQNFSEYALNPRLIGNTLNENKYAFVVVNNNYVIKELKKQFKNSSVIYMHQDQEDTDQYQKLIDQNISPEELQVRMKKQESMFIDYCNNPLKYDGVFISNANNLDRLVEHADNLLMQIQR